MARIQPDDLSALRQRCRTTRLAADRHITGEAPRAACLLQIRQHTLANMRDHLLAPSDILAAMAALSRVTRQSSSCHSAYKIN